MESHYLTLNQEHWDKQAAMENQWSKPVSDEEIIAAKQGDWKVHLTPSPVKSEWLGDIKDKKNTLFSFCWWATSAYLGGCRWHCDCV